LRAAIYLRKANNISKPVTIVGGGLAGLGLGIGLRQRDVPVTVWEAGRYPRHRVCGEFISGKGTAVLTRLGLHPQIEAADAFSASTAMFVAGPHCSPVRALPEPALCLSRFYLDALLAKCFQELGGDLRENARWTWTEQNESIVRAAGRRPQSKEKGWRWFGVKAHVSASTPVALAADLEMHASARGYVGVNRIDNGQTNVCGLFRARPGEHLPVSRLDLLRGEPGSRLHELLEGVSFDQGSFCSVAGLALQPHRAADADGCCIGDALTMTPPVTGNGMSMALESAEIAIGPVAGYSRGELSWAEAGRDVAIACDAAFGQRLAWARWLQRLMFLPVLGSGMGRVLLRSNTLWDVMFRNTR
jgi:flavin-dependent dehydrogenase